MEQTNVTLNKLRSVSSNTQVLAYTFTFGQFYFVAIPLARSGTKLGTHVKSNNRGNWELNGKDGWYVGPLLQYY